MSLYITSDQNTTVTVEVAGLSKETKTITANSITIFDVPDGARLTREGKSANGIHVTAEQPVVVYSHIFASNVSGATLVLPTNTLGKDYYSINYTQVSNELNSYSYFFVVAVEDNTEVEIIPAAATVGGWAPGSVNRVVLQKGEIYQVLGALTTNSGNTSGGGDLTGSRIRAISTTQEQCKRIAVFSGSGKISIGCANQTGSSDNLFQQVYPTAAWGKRFVTMPLQSRNYDVYRVVKSDPSAIVKMNGVVIPASEFKNDFYYDFPSQQANYIESDKAIQVAQYAVSQNRTINCTIVNESYGDPDMIYLNPLEQNIDNVTLYSTGDYAIAVHFINVVIETVAVGSFKLDDVDVSSSFSPVPGQPNYSYAQLKVLRGVHNISADAGFNAVAYGFGEAESYGYSAGTNVKSFTVEARDVITQRVIENICTNSKFTFKIKLKYKTDRLVWNRGDGTASVEIINPQPLDNNPANGIYEYEYPGELSYSAAGDYLIKATANNLAADGCAGSEVIETVMPVFAPPTSSFRLPGDLCLNISTKFTDTSEGNGKLVSNWLWDFGDGTTSTDQNPNHTFTTTGKFVVRLTVTGETGCGSDVFQKEITVHKIPLAAFNFVNPICDDKVFSFSDASTSADGAIVKWIWDAGDGSTVVESLSKSDFQHHYKISGNYTVKLRVLSEFGCESNVFEKQVVVNSAPVADFIIPDVCINDQYAVFLNSSKDANGGSLIYKWNFGDALATALSPNTSNLKEPRHKYSKAGEYTVTLSVTSASGCESVIAKTFTVNGATPHASFEVLKPTTLCSNKEVVVTSTASVDFGSITKIEWFADYLNAPSVKITDDDPQPGKQYRFQYPVFTSPSSKTVSMRMLAYSGGTCVDEEIQTITLLAAPKVEFALIDDVCLERSPFVFNQGKEINGQAGKGSYYGKGISQNGLFSPALAGLGKHVVKYVFIANNGCADSLTREFTVMPTPVVNAGRDTLLFEGDQIQLRSTALGSNLKYKWFPATGLSRDDIPDPIASPHDDLVYTLRVTSDQGCIASDQVGVKVLKTPSVPNAFSPNGDGVNDVWNIKNLKNYPNPSIQVFSRYGDRVFSSFSSADIAWDGKLNGIDIPVGTYYYIVKPGSGKAPISGSVTVLR